MIHCEARELWIVDRNYVNPPARQSTVGKGAAVLARATGGSPPLQRCPLKTVQELLGHTQLAMTQHYAHLEPHEKHESVRLLDGLVHRQVGAG